MFVDFNVTKQLNETFLTMLIDQGPNPLAIRKTAKKQSGGPPHQQTKVRCRNGTFK
jgi:hypothetical protein